MKVFVVVSWDRNDIVGVAKDRFAIARVIADHLCCSTSRVEQGQHTAKADVEGRDRSGKPRYVTYKFHVHEQEVKGV